MKNDGFIILGIDPGSIKTGYGAINVISNTFRHIDNGLIMPPKGMEFKERVAYIFQGICDTIREFKPDYLALEDIFISVNAQSALKLGQARGAAILAGVNAGLTVYEYSALQIKQAVVGYGRAGKDQVGEMIGCLFGLRETLEPNAADALAVAVCHLNTQASRSRWKLPGAL